MVAMSTNELAQFGSLNGGDAISLDRLARCLGEYGLEHVQMNYEKLPLWSEARFISQGLSNLNGPAFQTAIAALQTSHKKLVQAEVQVAQATQKLNAVRTRWVDGAGDMKASERKLQTWVNTSQDALDSASTFVTRRVLREPQPSSFLVSPEILAKNRSGFDQALETYWALFQERGLPRAGRNDMDWEDFERSVKALNALQVEVEYRSEALRTEEAKRGKLIAVYDKDRMKLIGILQTLPESSRVALWRSWM